jgi:hypothetical protein
VIPRGWECKFDGQYIRNAGCGRDRGEHETGARTGALPDGPGLRGCGMRPCRISSHVPGTLNLQSLTLQSSGKARGQSRPCCRDAKPVEEISGGQPARYESKGSRRARERVTAIIDTIAKARTGWISISKCVTGTWAESRSTSMARRLPAMYRPFLVFGVHPKNVSKITALGMATATATTSANLRSLSRRSFRSAGGHRLYSEVGVVSMW